jgi:hypothetical protein
MDCSEKNFMSSQAGYGLMIAKNSELPSLYAPVEDWIKALDRIAELSCVMAERQIAKNHVREWEEKEFLKREMGIK